MLIGALHGLEPGHSKTMIAAYIIAIKGSVVQAFLLGISAAFSHSIIVWILAFIALTFGNELIGEELEPWFMIVSGLIILSMALWIAKPLLSRFVRKFNQKHDHGRSDHLHDHDHRDRAHMDAHTEHHAKEIEAQLASGKKGNWQTIIFGLTGGLLPCPAAITVFIICMNLGQFYLGVALVGAFSIGLAVILVVIGAVAALGLKYISEKTSVFAWVSSRAPYFSSSLIALIGFAFIFNGYFHLQ